MKLTERDGLRLLGNRPVFLDTPLHDMKPIGGLIVAFMCSCGDAASLAFDYSAFEFV